MLRNPDMAPLKRDPQSVEYDYFLSKRTDIYAVVMHDKVTNIGGGTAVAAGLMQRF